ncbi:DUF3160 domain-containing protein [Tissierellaceae bacterium HCP3S3_D8]
MKSKRYLSSIVSLVLVMAIAIVLTGCVSKDGDKGQKEESNRDEIEGKLEEKIQPKLISVPYEPIKIEANVQPYMVNKDLSNIVNLSQFGEFSKGQLELLIANNFVVNPSKEEQLFYIYEDNEYKYIPSFITTDSVLQAYHIFYDYTLRTIESEKLLGKLEELTKSMLDRSIELYDEIEDSEVKEAQIKNIAFFTVASYCLEKDLPSNVPKSAIDMAKEEYDKILNHGGFSSSSIFPYKLDYSQYTIRGHYTRSDDFKRYFRAMMWYGQAPFPLYLEQKKDVEKRNIEQTIQALLITHSLYSDKESYDLWENIYEPTNFFVGNSDDLNINNYGDILYRVYGDKPDLNRLNDETKLDEFYIEADKLPEPKIQAKYTDVDTPSGKQFRFMGQRYVLDAEILQELVEPIKRPIPSGLDIMGVLGSERAEKMQKDNPINRDWEDYPKRFDELKEKFQSLEDRDWMSNIYQGWLWTLKGFLKSYGEGYPSFMTNEAWVDKDLNTALGSWSELKHDTILYGKQSGAEMGGGTFEEVVGYVEPNIEVYEKLLWLTKFSRENLKQRGLSIEDIDTKMERFENILKFLIDCSIKELNNEVLTSDEYEFIQMYGGILEDIMSSFAGDGLRWFEITSETDRNMAVIADFHTIAPNKYSEGGYMEAGVGPAYEIYVVVPIDGKLYLTRGAIFSYHEFISGERLTDEKWQEMIETGKAPNMPSWTDSFIRGGKGEIPFTEK